MTILLPSVVTIKWNNRPLEKDVDHILAQFEKGRELLVKMSRDNDFQPPDVPNVQMDETFRNAGLPLPGDK